MSGPRATKASRRDSRRRPRASRRKDARPAEIIEASLLEFSRNGYAATRLEDIAARAGVVKGTIYRYFADKDALFAAAVRSQAPDLGRDLGSELDSLDVPTRALLTLLLKQAYAELGDGKRHALMRIVVTEGSKFPAVAELVYRDAVGRVLPFLEKIVARGIARGEIRPDVPRAMPLMIIAPAFMASLWRMIFEPFEPLPTEDFFEAHLDLLCRGLLIDPPSRRA